MKSRLDDYMELSEFFEFCEWQIRTFEQPSASCSKILLKLAMVSTQVIDDVLCDHDIIKQSKAWKDFEKSIKLIQLG
jgi:hypothetical protein